jgi:hypothetical protein
MLVGQIRSLMEIKIDLFREFQKLSQNHIVSLRSSNKLEKPCGTRTSGSKYCWTK